MINIIYGAKGSGKTQRIIDAANDRARSGKGSLVYITDRPEHSKDVDNSIRFVDIKSYGLDSEIAVISFIKGLLAGNYDITDVYLDGLAKFIGKDVSDLESALASLDLIASDGNVSFTVTVTAEEPPQFMRKYI